MSILHSIIYSMRKSKKLKKISQRLKPKIDDIHDFLSSIDSFNKTADLALEDLLDLAENDANIKIVMEKYNANRDTLRDIYHSLNNIKASLMAKGHLVKASSIVFPQTLDYLLKNKDNLQTDLDRICDRLYKYFENGEMNYIA